MAAHAGALLKQWRQRRRLSQQAVAHLAEVSQRHLSCIETGRARPSRAILLHLAATLDVPLRERNALLIAAGYAPSYSQASFDAPEMARVRDALDKVLAGHEPYPAVVVDRRWTLVAANGAARALLGAGIDPALLDPPANVMRISLHPDGLAPRIINLAEWRAQLLGRLSRQVLLTGDDDLVSLLDELRHLDDGQDVPVMTEAPLDVAIPLRLRDGDGELAFFSTIATFGTAIDVTLAELTIEAFFPADEETAAGLRGR